MREISINKGQRRVRGARVGVACTPCYQYRRYILACIALVAFALEQ